MDAYKVGIILLLVFGAMSMEITIGTAIAGPLICLDVKYMTCQSSGDAKLSPKCNCCLAPKNCTLHLADGSSVNC